MVFLIQFSVTKIIKAFFLSWAMLYPPRAHFMFSTAQGIANHNFFIKRISIIESQLPSFFNNFDPRATAANFPSGAQAYLAGLTFALAVSPCSTPVLATLLGYVAASKSLLSFRKFSAWINPMRYFLPIFWH